MKGMVLPSSIRAAAFSICQSSAGNSAARVSKIFKCSFLSFVIYSFARAHEKAAHPAKARRPSLRQQEATICWYAYFFIITKLDGIVKLTVLFNFWQRWLLAFWCNFLHLRRQDKSLWGADGYRIYLSDFIFLHFSRYFRCKKWQSTIFYIENHVEAL